MKTSIALLLALSLLACQSPSSSHSKSLTLTDNEELKQIYAADQADRQSGEIDWSEVSVRDDERMARVYQMIDSGLVQTAADHANAAMIFQHGGDTIASGMAVSMMKKAIELDSTINKWLYAAAVDRDLMRRKEPQIYGTQYIKSSADAPWELYNLDSTQITDEGRREYGVETLAQQRAKVLQMNKLKLSSMLNEGKSMDEIIAFCEAADLKKSEYDLSESAINDFGYQLMADNKDQDALKIFLLNTQLYPNGFNTYDSYGECLVKVGQVEAGIAAYEKSLELNPKNDNATQILAGLKQK